MPKKTKGGNKHKKAKNSTDPNERLNMVYKEEGEEYAYIDKMLGGSRCTIRLPDQTTKLGIIRGKLRRRKTWICVGDLVLVGIRSYQDDKCDILHKYTQGQVQILKKANSIPIGLFNNTIQPDKELINQESCQIEFKDEDSDDSDELDKQKSIEIEDNIEDKNKDLFEFDWDEI